MVILIKFIETFVLLNENVGFLSYNRRYIWSKCGHRQRGQGVGQILRFRWHNLQKQRSSSSLLQCCRCLHPCVCHQQPRVIPHHGFLEKRYWQEQREERCSGNCTGEQIGLGGGKTSGLLSGFFVGCQGTCEALWGVCLRPTNSDRAICLPLLKTKPSSTEIHISPVEYGKEQNQRLILHSPSSVF